MAIIQQSRPWLTLLWVGLLSQYLVDCLACKAQVLDLYYDSNNVAGRAKYHGVMGSVQWIGDFPDLQTCITEAMTNGSYQSVTYHQPNFTADHRYAKGCYGDTSNYWVNKTEVNIASARFVPCFLCDAHQKMCIAYKAGTYTGYENCASALTLGCPIPHPNSTRLSIGGFSLIGVGAVAFLYLAIGISVQRYRGESGANLIPNKNAWTTIASLVKEGFTFSFQRCRLSFKVKFKNYEDL
eukprot:m.19668 g.19668  ORF g.19668 m.19668 type:complete len:239 (-) comp12554_c0_seq1:206-922(-)